MNEQQVAAAIEILIGETNPDVFIVEVRLHRGKHNVLSVQIDTDRGIRIEECTELSRVMSAWFDEKDVFDFPYTLEVSSPGLDQPLKLHRQYVKNIGRKLNVVTKTGEATKGKLLEVTKAALLLEPEMGKVRKKDAQVPQPIWIEFEKIKTAKVLVSFN
jgi:ribosome maturation factor RimP